MKTIFENVINRGDFNLKGILSKIDICYIEGKLTEEERNYLTNLARNNAQTENSIDVFKKLEEMDARIKALEEGKTTEPTEEYPSFVEGKWYYRGDRCSEDNINYICIAPEGVVCTWSPSDYPAYWEKK